MICICRETMQPMGAKGYGNPKCGYWCPKCGRFLFVSIYSDEREWYIPEEGQRKIDYKASAAQEMYETLYATLNMLNGYVTASDNEQLKIKIKRVISKAEGKIK